MKELTCCSLSNLNLVSVNSLYYICDQDYHGFSKHFYFQGSKISDKSHNQETTDLHKCISRIHHRTPEHEKHNVSSNLMFLVLILLFLFSKAYGLIFSINKIHICTKFIGQWDLLFSFKYCSCVSLLLEH